MPTSNPSVCAVMLANGRPELVARAVKSFRAQTYSHRTLWIFDTSSKYETLQGVYDPPEPFPMSPSVQLCHEPSWAGKSIGALRNEATSRTHSFSTDILIHWDSDDWSHPNRIAEQVALLQSSGAECVGYSEMLFWDSRVLRSFGDGCILRNRAENAVWLYRSSLPNYAIGTSMCYWRETWERAPFPDYSEGCDDLYWFNGDKKSGVKPVNIESVSSVPRQTTAVDKEIYARVVKQYYPDEVPANLKLPDESPRMIASIHGGNTCASIKPGVEWTRVPDWDAYCRKEMAL